MPQKSLVKGKPTKLTPDEQELSDRLSIKGLWDDDIVTKEGLRVSRPPSARQPSVIVGTDLAKEFEKLARVAPEIRGRAKVITPGLTSELISKIVRDDAPSYLLGAPRPRLNILGMTDEPKREIYSSQTGDSREDIDTLAHELQHLVGLKGFNNIYNNIVNGEVTNDGSNYDSFRKQAMLGNEDNARKTGQLAGKVFYDKPVIANLRDTLLNSLVSRVRGSR